MELRGFYQRRALKQRAHPILRLSRFRAQMLDGRFDVAQVVSGRVRGDLINPRAWDVVHRASHVVGVDEVC